MADDLPDRAETAPEDAGDALDDGPGLGLDEPPQPAAGTAGGDDYRVLARKYRPQTFDDLIGQEAMVRTLSNAFASGRIAHGFILTGVRGVGKTTTARIIAKGLNCVGPNGTDGPTIKPCGVCEYCTSIAESRNVDVFEMDAASRTGIDDIREIIESVRYRPASARYKVYIIDEVHMLSKQAFNGLLKTLEEPPPHVKFIFATTEIRKVPITVLSRCQRFDLRRIDADLLISHLTKIAEAEATKAGAGAMALIARAAEGSVRDALSLLDQAIAHGEPGADGLTHLSETGVRDMLGLADRARVIDLFALTMSGDMPGALAELKAQYDQGADPVVILQDLLDLTHWLTRLKVVPEAAKDATVSETERVKGQEMADSLSMAALTRTWQMLLKGLSEAQGAPNAFAAAEMALIRLGYASSLRTPDEVLKMLDTGAASGAASGAATTPRSGGQPSAHAGSNGGNGSSAHGASTSTRASSPPPTSPSSGPAGGGARLSAVQGGRSEAPAPAPRMEIESDPEAFTRHFATLEEFLDALSEDREDMLVAAIEAGVHLVKFEQGRIEFRPSARARDDLVEKMQAQLQRLTGARWIITLRNEGGAPTPAEVKRAAREEKLAEIRAHPLVKAAMETFPDGKLGEIIVEAEEDAQAASFDPSTEGFAELDPDDDDF